MNKTRVIMVIALACIAVILGIYYEYHNQVAFKMIYPDNKNYTDEEIQVKAEAITETSGNLSYTDEELKALYQRYNTTENDLKFARGELSNYLEGIVLQSITRVLVTQIGEPPEGLREGVDYDVVMSEQEMSRIIKEAGAAYIEKYGVNPADPKLDSYNGCLLPNEEVRRLVSLNMVSNRIKIINLFNLVFNLFFNSVFNLRSSRPAFLFQGFSAGASIDQVIK